VPNHPRKGLKIPVVQAPNPDIVKVVRTLLSREQAIALLIFQF
jgi:hypothetical protein